MFKFKVNYNIFRPLKEFAPRTGYSSGLNHKVSILVEAQDFDSAIDLANEKVKKLFRYSDKYDAPNVFVSQVELI